MDYLEFISKIENEIAGYKNAIDVEVLNRRATQDIMGPVSKRVSDIIFDSNHGILYIEIEDDLCLHEEN